MSAPLAKTLWDARSGGGLVEPPQPVPDVDEAYVIQAQIVELSGMRQVGWKVGSTSRAAQATLGTAQPSAGPLLDGFCFPSRADVPIFPQHFTHVEGEFAFRVGRNFPNEPELDHAAIADHIDALIPGIEVVGSRFASGLQGTGRALLTADGSANIAFIGGSPIFSWQPDQLSEQSVLIYKNGTLVESGVGADALGHPLNVMQWLQRYCVERGLQLRAGEVITTGTCTGLIPILPGDSVEVHFPGLGKVAASFVADSKTI